MCLNEDRLPTSPGPSRHAPVVPPASRGPAPSDTESGRGECDFPGEELGLRPLPSPPQSLYPGREGVTSSLECVVEGDLLSRQDRRQTDRGRGQTRYPVSTWVSRVDRGVGRKGNYLGGTQGWVVDAFDLLENKEEGAPTSRDTPEGKTGPGEPRFGW